MTRDDVRLPAANEKKIYFSSTQSRKGTYRDVVVQSQSRVWLGAVSDKMATVDDACGGCIYSNWEFTANFFQKSTVAADFLRRHGVLPRSVECPNCKLPCKLRQDRHQWYCGRYRALPKRKRSKQCNFTVSDYKGTFLEGTHLPVWELLLFCNHWLQKVWDHSSVFECLKWSPHTSVDWRSFCSEVTLDWLRKQEPIGGDGVVVEIDETFFVKRKHERGRPLSSVWVFGGIERVTKKKFIVPLIEENQDRSAASLIPLIKKYILPGTIIVSDGWKAYSSVGSEGYTHWVVNHAEHFVDPQNKEIHTQTIERFWRDIKEWTKRPGIKSQYFEQYFARYLFIKENYKHRHHQFFLAAARLYPPQSTREPAGQRAPAIPLEEVDALEELQPHCEAGPSTSA